MNGERTEEVVRMDACMWALVAEMNACVARVAAMTAANTEREHRDRSIAYDERPFFVESERLDALATLLRERI